MSHMYKLVTALAAIFLLSSIVPTSAHAATTMEGNGQDHSQAKNEQFYQEDDHFGSFLHSFFNNNNWDRHWQDQGENEIDQSEAPEIEEAPQKTDQDVDRETKDQSPTGDSELKQAEQEVVELTNEERGKQGLQPLKVDHSLSEVALEKSKDMQANGYFDHNSPTYGSPFDMMETFGVDYSSAAENIAKGQTTPEEVVDGWMNSDGHRQNIMNGSFTHIGVGYAEEGNVWTQQFISK